MAELTPLLREIKGVYSDRARDRLPAGTVWAMTDFIPEILQAGARMRGAWVYQSTDVFANPIEGMIFAPFKTGSRLLASTNGDLRVVPDGAPGASSSIGTIGSIVQNPVFHRNRVIAPIAGGATAARFITFNGTSFTLTDAPASALTGRFATVWKDRLVLGNSSAEPQQVAFCKPGDPTVAWDSLSFVNTSYDLTGLASQRTQVLCFHADSIERLRGTTPPDSTLTDPTGDLLLDLLWDRAGCYDARSIAYWQENVLFADKGGIWLTDGAIVRNMAVQGGVLNLWRAAWERGGQPDTVGGVVHRDYYLCCQRKSGFSPVTFLTHVPTRETVMLSNIDSPVFAYGIGGDERLYGVNAATKQVTDLTPFLDPDSTILQVDGNGTAVLPSLSTHWDMLSKKPGFKRIQEIHFSYVAARDDDVDTIGVWYVSTPTGADQVLGSLKPNTLFDRRKLSLGARLEGVGLRLTQLVATKDTRLYDISARAYVEESTRMKVA